MVNTTLTTPTVSASDHQKSGHAPAELQPFRARSVEGSCLPPRAERSSPGSEPPARHGSGSTAVHGHRPAPTSRRYELGDAVSDGVAGLGAQDDHQEPSSRATARRRAGSGMRSRPACVEVAAPDIRTVGFPVRAMSVTAPCMRIRPRSMIATCSHVFSTSSSRWEERKTVAALVHEVGHHLAELLDARRVEPVHRLVEDQELRIGQEASRHAEALTHAHRVPRDPLVGASRQPDARERSGDSIVGLALSAPRRRRGGSHGR